MIRHAIPHVADAHAGYTLAVISEVAMNALRTLVSAILSAALFSAAAACAALAAPPGPLPERVTFVSGDGTTMLIGYVFKPQGAHPARVPAVVMMHGRAGAYSSAANGNYSAATLSKRHQEWGHIWAQRGYLAVLVDGFGPRGYAAGFPRFSYETRPESLNEVTVRPLDAYGALAYLRKRNDVVADRVALQGWSNGASATLATMSVDAPGITSPTPATGFRGALAFYPECGVKGQFPNGVMPYAPVRVLHGDADEEVSPRRCAVLVEKSAARGGDIQFQLYPGATHGFDDPNPVHQDNPANATATADAIARATAFFDSVLRK
jgi:dienelactone hydrolase